MAKPPFADFSYLLRPPDILDSVGYLHFRYRSFSARQAHEYLGPSDAHAMKNNTLEKWARIRQVRQLLVLNLLPIALDTQFTDYQALLACCNELDLPPSPTLPSSRRHYWTLQSSVITTHASAGGKYHERRPERDAPPDATGAAIACGKGARKPR